MAAHLGKIGYASWRGSFADGLMALMGPPARK
jgi:hypothetical protein